MATAPPAGPSRPAPGPVARSIEDLDPFPYIPTRQLGYHSKWGLTFGIACVLTFLTWCIVIMIQFATAYANTFSSSVERDPSLVISPEFLGKRDFNFSIGLACSNIRCPDFLWRVRFRQRSYVNGSSLAQVSQDIEPVTCTLYTNDGLPVADTVDSSCVSIHIPSNASDVGYPRLQGTFGDRVYSFVQADVYFTSGLPNTTADQALALTTMRVNLGFRQLYFNNLRVRDGHLRHGIAAEVYRFESTTFLRPKVDFYLLPRQITRESSMINLQYFQEAYTDLIFDRHVSVWDEALINGYPTFTYPNGTQGNGTEWLLGTFYWRLSESIATVDIQPNYDFWSIISNVGAAIALTAFVFGLPARAINQRLFAKSLTIAVREGEFESMILVKSFTNNGQDANSVLKKLKVLEKERKGLNPSSLRSSVDLSHHSTPRALGSSHSRKLRSKGSLWRFMSQSRSHDRSMNAATSGDPDPSFSHQDSMGSGTGNGADPPATLDSTVRHSLSPIVSCIEPADDIVLSPAPPLAATGGRALNVRSRPLVAGAVTSFRASDNLTAIATFASDRIGGVGTTGAMTLDVSPSDLNQLNMARAVRGANSLLAPLHMHRSKPATYKFNG